MIKNKSITYASTGVKYDAMDPIKRIAQAMAKTTSNNLQDLGFKEIPESRGESAHVVDVGPFYLATVMEGLGTKNPVADSIRVAKGPSFYNKIAQDTVAMIVNDLVVVGARPLVVSAYWAAGSGEWFKDITRSKELAKGWAKACNKAEAIYGGGEIPTLKGIINPQTVDLAGSAVGIIQPKSRLTLGSNISEGDRILLAPSSGIHANGLTLARRIAAKISSGYNTRLSDGRTYGEALLEPTPIYSRLVRELFDAGIDIHYMVNVTGHGWRKLMRATRKYRYVIDTIPKPQPEFDFIREQSGNSLAEMYGNFNMGAGFAFFIPENDVKKALNVAKVKANINLLNAGVVESGSKEVVIKPINLTFKGKSLAVR